ncbi:sensor histidine kinase [Zunongwangia endophytica]|uniref:Sensor histidine kinase n=1 Tax=Zunongwangia endophytica TaxID=1808945 RepID=A0ABV8H5E8_9FLAO|nr:histidine kinase [Zunongwangia endophytica]MDN3596089.1 histidine kinase [Zunongwangia endophytica]
MTKKQEVTYHLIFWVLFFAMDIFAEIVLQGSTTFSLKDLEFALLQMSLFYLVYSFIAPKTIPQKKWGYLCLGLIFSLLYFVGLRYLIEEVIVYSFTGVHNYYENSRKPLYYIFDNSYYAIRIFLLSLIFYFVKYQFSINKRISELSLEKKQAELQVLKSQLSPHFLFNTLNSFYADALVVDEKLSDDILKLSEMLRYVTYENEGEYVLLKDEIHFIKNYINLFQRRFSNQLFINASFPEAVGNEKIPALLLIHFVENAFKHGILNQPEKPVDILLKIDKNQLHFKVENFFKPQQNYDESGIGYKNIEQRLALLFGKDYHLEHFSKENSYFVTLQFPLD